MTRLLPLLALATACTTDDTLHMEMMSSMESQTRGVVLYDDGQRGHAAMWDTTCEFDTLNGWLIEDHDLPTETEVVHDHYAGRVLGRSDEGVHIVQDRDLDRVVGDVVHSRLVDDNGRGQVALIRDTPAGCVADVRGAVTPVPQAVCKPGIEVGVDRAGELYAATGDELLRIGPDGVENIYGDADLVVFDLYEKMVYTARSGDKFVTGLFPDGTERWRTEVPGYVTSLEHMGERGNALVMVENPDNGGGLIVIQGASGEIVTDHQTPSGDGDIVMSDDGRTLAVVMPANVYFYDVTAESEPKKARRTFGSPDPTFLD